MHMIVHATFQSNCAEGLHFSAFHLLVKQLDNVGMLACKF